MRAADSGSIVDEGRAGVAVVVSLSRALGSDPEELVYPLAAGRFVGRGVFVEAGGWIEEAKLVEGCSAGAGVPGDASEGESLGGEVGDVEDDDFSLLSDILTAYEST